MPVSEYVPFKNNPYCNIRSNADQAFGDLARLVGEGETLTSNGVPNHNQAYAEPVEAPRRPALTPVAPVPYDVPVAEVHEDQLPSWVRAKPEDSAPFDFDLHGRLEEAFGTPVHQEAMPNVFDSIVEQELAAELNVAQQPMQQPHQPQPMQQPQYEPVSAPMPDVSAYSAAPAQPAPQSVDDFDAELAAELNRALSDEMLDAPAAAKPQFAHETATNAASLASQSTDPFAEELAKLLKANPAEAAPAPMPQPAPQPAPQAAAQPVFSPAPQQPVYTAPAASAPAAFSENSSAEQNLYSANPYESEQTNFDPGVLAQFAEEQSGRSRTRSVALAVLTVALLGGTAAFALNFFQSESGPAPVILADNAPIKVRPEETGGLVVPNQDQAVYREVEGISQEPANQARLEGATEEPIKVSTAKPVSESEALLRPRSVRTVTVRPDGTLVSQNGEAAAPPQRLGEPTLALGNNNTANAPTNGSNVENTVAAAPVVAQPVAPVITTPEPTPVEQVAAVTPAPAPAPTPAPAVNAAAAPFAVQISSQRSEAAAQSSYETLSSRYASALSGRGVDIRRADIEGKGTYYRVRIPAQTRQEANALCEQLKAAGGSCFVTR